MLQRFPNRSILTRLGQGIHNLPKSGSTVLVPATADSPSPKRRLRGGQNLSARWQRLEASLREKGSLMHTIDSLPISASLSTSTVDAGDLPVPSKISRPHVETFRGFIVPEAPQEPGPDECCMSGCAICVNDLYAEAVEAYKGSLRDLRSSLKAAGVPEAEWPTKVLENGTIAASNGKNVALNAFEEMERALAAKKIAQSQSVM